MADEPQCQLRRRRSSENPNLPLNLESGYQVTDGGPDQGTPTPSNFKLITNNSELPATSALKEFRKKQQSFDVGFDIQIEECEEEEIIVDSDEEGGENELGATGLAGAGGAGRPVTPTPIQDFGANVTYSEGPQAMAFLKVKTIEHDCITDVSDAESEEEE